MKKLIVAAGILLLGAGGAWAGKGHQHGFATVSIAIEGSSVELEFESPLENLVGFEHAPRNDRERRALQAMKERFADPGALFVPDAAAQCRAAPAQLELPQAGHGAEHADLRALVRFDCAQPAALRGLEVKLFEPFPRLRRVAVQVAAPGRQGGADLSRRKPRIDW